MGSPTMDQPAEVNNLCYVQAAWSSGIGIAHQRNPKYNFVEAIHETTIRIEITTTCCGSLAASWPPTIQRVRADVRRPLRNEQAQRDAVPAGVLGVGACRGVLLAGRWSGIQKSRNIDTLSICRDFDLPQAIAMLLLRVLLLAAARFRRWGRRSDWLGRG
jgi:hypothetical protein